MPLAKLEPSHVDRMLAGLKGRGDLSATTVRYSYVVLRVALGRALKTGAWRATPRLSSTRRSRTRSRYGRSRVSRSGRSWRAPRATGTRRCTRSPWPRLRQGELLGLRWSDVDLEAGTLTVRHTLRTGTDQLAEPKSERSKRTLRLGADMLATLRAHRTRQLEERLTAGSRWRDGGFVFATALGRPLNTWNVTHTFQAALERAGLPRQRLHDLRHACATLLLEDGEELDAISRLLGHPDFSTTANLYAHVTPATLQRSADRMDGILRPRRAMSEGQIRGMAWGTGKDDGPQISRLRAISCVDLW